MSGRESVPSTVPHDVVCTAILSSSMGRHWLRPPPRCEHRVLRAGLPASGRVVPPTGRRFRSSSSSGDSALRAALATLPEEVSPRLIVEWRIEKLIMRLWEHLSLYGLAPTTVDVRIGSS